MHRLWKVPAACCLAVGVTMLSSGDVVELLEYMVAVEELRECLREAV